MTASNTKINIIGAGQLGKTLGYLFNQQSGLKVADVLNQSLASAQRAVEFIGAGRAIAQLSEMRPADYYLLACPDKQIESCCQQLAGSGWLKSGTTVFHCSGALNSAVLHSASGQGAQVASVHPVRSFADPAQAVEQFPGTYCGMEGDVVACAKLEPIFEAMGAINFRIDPAQKTLYHAASVMACNYLVALQEVSLQAFEQAGLERELGMKILQPLVEGTVKNVFASGTEAALTGPVARGEYEVVAKQVKALRVWSPEVAVLYRSLGHQALRLAVRRAGQTSDSEMAALEKILTFNSSADTPS